MELEQNNKTKRPIRVLVVEDEILVSEWVAQERTEQGFAVQAATNADDAAGRLATQAIDVLFTDLNLPGGMNGAALARRARQLWPNLAVVYASASATALAPEARFPAPLSCRSPITRRWSADC